MIEITCAIRKEDGQMYNFTASKRTKKDANDLAERLKKNGYINIQIHSQLKPTNNKILDINEEDKELLGSIYQKSDKLVDVEPTENEEI